VNLIDDWQALAPRLWSIRLALLAAALGAMEVALPLFQTVIPPMWFGVASVVVGIGSAIARLIAQPRAREEAKTE